MASSRISERSDPICLEKDYKDLVHTSGRKYCQGCEYGSNRADTPHLALSKLSTTRTSSLTGLVTSTRQPPPTCRRKSSSDPASPSASMLATYVSQTPLRTNETRREGRNSTISHGLTEVLIQKVTPRQPKPRVSRMKGHLSKRTAFVRDVVKEVSGYARPQIEGRRRVKRTVAHTDPYAFAALHRTSAVSSNSSATAKTSAQGSWRRRGSAPSAVRRERWTR